MSSVLVTGAAGRIGRRVVERLLSEHHTVTALDLLPLGIDNPALRKVTGELENPLVVKQAIDDVDHIIHLAAQQSSLNADHAHLFQANVEGTRVLLEAAVNADVQRFILASSSEVYAQNTPENNAPADESAPLAPGSFFGLTKQLGEQLVQFYARQYGLQTTILRLSYTQDVDELLNPNSVLSGPLFFLRAKIDQQIKLDHRDVAAHLRQYDDGNEKLVLSCNENGQPFNMTISDSRDIVEGILLALKHPLAVGQVFNLAADDSADFAEALPRIAEITGLPVVTVNFPGTGIGSLISNQLLRETLGFKPVHSFASMLDEAAQTR